MTSTPETPNLDKMREVSDEAETLTRFVAWLEADGIVLARYGARYDVRVPCPSCHKHTEGSGRTPRALVTNAGGLDVAKLTPREKQLLRTPEGVTAYKATLLASKPCPECRGEMWVYREKVEDGALVPIIEGFERLFARFFGVDHDEAESERMRLLEWVRARRGS